MKVRDLTTILGRLEPGAHIALERTRQSALPGVVEVEHYEIGIKRNAESASGGAEARPTYALYATAKLGVADGGGDQRASVLSLDSDEPSRRRPVMERVSLVGSRNEDDAAR